VTVEARLAEELDYLPTRDRKRAEREGAEAAKRAARRARAGALDQALQLTGPWFRDVAAVADGAPEVVHAVDRLDALGEDAQGRDPHRLRAAVETIDDARALLILNPSEELLLEALAYRLARALRTS
jgi:DNA polymerase III subunit delta'